MVKSSFLTIDINKSIDLCCEACSKSLININFIKIVSSSNGKPSYYCAQHGREKLETIQAALRFQIGEIDQMIQKFPKKTKLKTEDINLGEHL